MRKGRKSRNLDSLLRRPKDPGANDPGRPKTTPNKQPLSLTHMGTSCSSIISDHDPELLEKDQTQAPRIRHISRPDTEPEPEPGPEPEPPIVKTTPPQRPLPVVTDSTRSKSKMSRSGRSKSKPKGPDPHEWTTVHVLDQIIDGKVGASGGGGGGGGTSSTGVTATTAADYEKSREELRRRERALGFEHKLASAATPKELRVDQILQALKRDDDKTVFAAAPARTGFGGQQHGRFAGDHFLSNRALIDQSKVFRVAKKVPKGAHLHIHFNACLLPNVLLEIAAGMEQMYITSDLPLVDAGPQSHQDPRGPEDRYHNLRRAKIQFSIMAQPASTGDLFAAGYRDREGAMRFREFLAAFPQRFPEEELGVDAMTWLQEKLVFREEEAHDLLQTVGGAWGEFNTRTQMMKGLFNYETAYRTYTRRCLEDFVADNIQYAEIRPNFMDTNQVWRDDGSAKLDNVGIMHMIIEEYDKFQTEARAKGKAGGYFGGMKIIYCCPRSYPKDKVAHGLKQCLEFKKRWPQWIAGESSVSTPPLSPPPPSWSHHPGEEVSHVKLTYVPSPRIRPRRRGIQRQSAPLLRARVPAVPARLPGGRGRDPVPVPLRRDARHGLRDGRQPAGRAAAPVEAHRPRVRARPPPVRDGAHEAAGRVPRGLPHLQRGPGPDAPRQRARHLQPPGQQRALHGEQ